SLRSSNVNRTKVRRYEMRKLVKTTPIGIIFVRARRRIPQEAGARSSGDLSQNLKGVSSRMRGCHSTRLTSSISTTKTLSLFLCDLFTSKKFPSSRLHQSDVWYARDTKRTRL